MKTSASFNAAPTSALILTPQALPQNSPASRPSVGLPGASAAPARRRSGDASTASISMRPMRPLLPAMAMRKPAMSETQLLPHAGEETLLLFGRFVGGRGPGVLCVRNFFGGRSGSRRGQRRVGRRRNDVAFEPDQGILFEIHRELALQDAAALAHLIAIYVVPAVGMKQICNQRRAHDEFHLLARHAGL